MSATTPLPSLPDGVELVREPLEHLVVQRQGSRAVIFLQGAHVTSWQPQGEAPVLFLSRSAYLAEGKPIRGGIPICFPWLGRGPEKDKEPSHGFARVRTWQLVEVREEGDAVVVVLELHDDDATRAIWPHAFAARYEVSVGQVLSASLTIRNTGGEPMTFEEALHTYVDVEDVRRARVEGLEGRDFVDGVDGGVTTRQEGPVRLTGGVDMVFQGDLPDPAVHDESRSRRIGMRTQRSRSTVVWNPGPEYVTSLRDMADDEWLRMLCVQTANVTDEAVTLAPGETHTLVLELSVTAAD